MTSYKNRINYVEPQVFKDAVLHKRTPKKLVQNFNPNKKYFNSSAIDFNKMNKRAAKYISDKRYREELDISSPGNKNIIIDSDSELTTNSKNNMNVNAGVTKLVIEKIESQMPQVNNEYYKFTNLKRNIINGNSTQEPFFSKKNYVTKKMARYGSNMRGNDRIIDGNYLNFNYKNHNISQQQRFEEYPEPMIKKNLNNAQNISMNKQHGGSTNNIFNSKYNYKQESSNKKPTNKNNSVIISKRYTSNKYNNDDEYDDENENEELYNKSPIVEKPNNVKYYRIGNNKNNYIRKNKDISINPQRNTLYENYQDLIKLNTFNRISQYNKGTRKYYKINNYKSYNKKIIKLQSVWRGTYVRILMGFYWNLVDFKNTLENIFKNHIYDYFFDLVKNSSHYPMKLNGENIDDYNNEVNYTEEKSLQEYKIALNQKEEDYENLLKNYNALVERCTELQDMLSKNKTEEKKNWSSSGKKSDNSFNFKLIDIKKNKINFGENTNSEQKNNEWKNLKIQNNNINLAIIIDKENYEYNNRDKLNRLKEIKKFNIIKIQQKEKFNIIQKNDIKGEMILNQEQEQENKDNQNNKNLRSKYKNKKKEIYQNYVDIFNSNLLMSKADQLIIEGTYKKKELKPLEISKIEMPLLNDKDIKEIEGIIKQKIFENEFIEKHNENELLIKGIKKITEKKQKEYNLSEENQNDLNIEIKGKDKNEINNKSNKKNIISSIVHKYELKSKEPIIVKSKGDQFNIMETKIFSKKPKIFENEFIEKNKENELLIKGIKKIKENNKKDYNLLKENQKDLSIEIKGKDIIEINNKNSNKNIISSNVNNYEIKSKEKIIKMSKGEQLNIINTIKTNNKPKIFEKEYIEKENENELLIIGVKKEIKNNKKKKGKNEKENNLTIDNEIKSEKQIINTSAEDKNKFINNVNIDNKPKIFEKEFLEKDNKDELSILGIKKEIKKAKKLKKKLGKNKKKENNLIEDNQKQNELNCKDTEINPQINRSFQDFIFIDKNNSIFIKRNFNRIQEINIPKQIIKKDDKNIFEKVEQFIIEGINLNKDSIILKSKNKKKKKLVEKKKINNEFIKSQIIPAINNNLFIKQKKKKRCDKMTEITEELNYILPCNNSELYIKNIIKKIIYVTNKEQEISFIKEIENDKNKFIYENIKLEIEKENALEINPLVIKKASEISQESDIEIPYNKYTFFTEKAKNNMMKMILPIKLKVTLREFIQKNTFPWLIKQLKEIAKFKQM